MSFNNDFNVFFIRDDFFQTTQLKTKKLYTRNRPHITKAGLSCKVTHHMAFITVVLFKHNFDSNSNIFNVFKDSFDKILLLFN